MKDFVLKPRMSEKTYGQSTTLRTFAFLVPQSANKHSVARAVKAQYDVDAVNVNILNQTGKKVRTYRNRRFTAGERSEFKKAYVTLKEGQSIPIFAAVEEAEKQAEKTQKAVDKKAGKSEVKAESQTETKVNSTAKTSGRRFFRKSGER